MQQLRAYGICRPQWIVVHTHDNDHAHAYTPTAVANKLKFTSGEKLRPQAIAPFAVGWVGFKTDFYSHIL